MLSLIVINHSKQNLKTTQKNQIEKHFQNNFNARDVMGVWNSKIHKFPRNEINYNVDYREFWTHWNFNNQKQHME